MADRTFPVLQPGVRGPKYVVPWALVAPHEAQARRNHYQPLERLAERGGLSWSEMLAVIEDRKWHAVPLEEAKAAILAAVAALPESELPA